MLELFTTMCDGAKRYPLDENADKTYKNGRDDTTGPPYEAKVRLVATARGLEGNNVGIYDKGRCKANFQAIMDECNDRGGEYAVDYINYKLYAFRTNPE
ncbi:MAG: hypothetical protein Q9173_007368 [Seirophora scorigena]